MDSLQSGSGRTHGGRTGMPARGGTPSAADHDAPGSVVAGARVRRCGSGAAPAAHVADTGSSSTTAAGALRPADSKSIAVLAFADLGQAGDQECVSDGAAEEIRNALAKVDDLRVAGRTSSFYFNRRSAPLAGIGSTPGVAHVLEGSVRRQRDRLRISAKLLRVGDGVELRAKTFDGTDGDIFALQENFAQPVTSQLKVALSAGQGRRLVEVGTTNPDACAL
jgi:TolB-like protein